MSTRTNLIVAPGILAVALFLGLPARGEDTEPGTWWEQTVEMGMKGMSMPPTTQKICVSKKGMTEPPRAGEDDRCKVTDVKNVGPKMTWKMECSPPDAMTGEGEMVRGKDRYTGSMSMHSSRGDMSMKMSGKLLGGDCDASATRKQAAAVKKQVEQQQKQSDDAMAEICEKGVQDVQLQLFAPPLGMCQKPEQVSRVCARLSTREGFLAYQKQAGLDRNAAKLAKSLCKQDLEVVKADLCAQAAKETRGDDTSRDVLDFIQGSCPDQARALAKKQCAGRSFTGMPEKWRGICVRYAREELSKGGEDVEPAADESKPEEPKKSAKDQAADQAKKALKGLFGK